MEHNPTLKEVVAYAFDQLERVPRDNDRLLMNLSVTISNRPGLDLAISTQIAGDGQNHSVHYAYGINTYKKVDKTVEGIILALKEYSPEAEVIRAEKALKAAEHRLAELRKAAGL